MIEIQGLSIFYGKRKLAYPDISVKKGEAVGIAGKSGCGKTSLFSFLLGELPDSAFSYERAELLGRGWNGLKRSAISRSLPRVP